MAKAILSSRKAKARSDAQSRAKPTAEDAVLQLTQTLLKINREAAISAALERDLDSETWARRVRRAKALLPGIEAKEYTWGAGFTGTKAALIKAGLLDAKMKTRKFSVENEKYQLPRNHFDGYEAACYGPTFGKIPPSWEATVRYEGPNLYFVAVEYNTDDMEVRKRTELALDEMARPDMSFTLLELLVTEIPPTPLSVRVPEQIKASKNYPTGKQRLAWRREQDRK